MLFVKGGAVGGKKKMRKGKGEGEGEEDLLIFRSLSLVPIKRYSMAHAPDDPKRDGRTERARRTLFPTISPVCAYCSLHSYESKV